MKPEKILHGSSWSAIELSRKTTGHSLRMPQRNIYQLNASANDNDNDVRVAQCMYLLEYVHVYTCIHCSCYSGLFVYTVLQYKSITACHVWHACMLPMALPTQVHV